MKNLEKLKKQGYRLTIPRQELLKILDSYPLTVQEMHEMLKKKNIRIDLASIYRSLELFVSMGIVHAIDLGEDKKRYEIVDKTNHHHHLFCNNCGTIEDIAINENIFLKELKQKTNFTVKSHTLEFFGLCSQCN